ncbi:MAG: FeS-binding protein [Zetaproteobacteria bacterium]|nr:MAG: FeS-binding protein [Zetaproteobacteria bacterium]
MKLRLYLTFNEDTVREPIIWKLGKQFDVVTNIRTAEVKDHMGLVGLEIEGADDVVERAVAWLGEQGVQVSPIEQNVLEG